MSTTLHAHTPTLATVDPRGLRVGSLAYCRSDEHQAAEARVTRHSYDPAGRLIASQDPRLSMPNQRTVYSLSGQVLLTDSVDAGWRLSLLGEAGQALTGWDSRGTERQSQYDELLRPLAITERDQVVERFTYGGPETADDNQCNQLTRHDDTAGTLYRPDYGLMGSPLTEVRHFLRELGLPDWPLAIAERAALLEANGLESGWAFNALNEVIEQTDAMGNTRQFKHTVAGQLKSVALGEQVLVSAIRYNAFDQVEQETAGNGVISRSTYDPQDGRLNELSAALADAPLLQLLKYAYDPVGNILQIEDAAQPVRFFANQRIEPVSHYRYDTLYQLIEASGREVKTAASHGPALPELQNLPIDPNQIANYTQHYEYDAGGNLLEMKHVGTQPFTRIMQVAANSNRSLPEEVDVGFANGFDANGNLQQLVRGQDLSWDARNQLRHITSVQRDNGPSDDEIYIYDGGQRCRKVSSAQAQNRTLINEVRYLPGLEIRTSADGEILHVISADAGRNSVRLLHWQARKPDDIDNNQLRYSLSDHLGSSTLELDHRGALISQESYYPFGGTAWWAASSEIDAKYKTVRYSGKERDASGLYYYGFRYYAPWLQRWVSPDPAGDVDGFNYYHFVSNSPVTKRDDTGHVGEEANKPYHSSNIYPAVLFDNPTSHAMDARPGTLWGDTADTLGTAYVYKPTWYYKHDLEQRLNLINTQAGLGSLIVTTMFEHEHDPLDNPYKITSRHWNEVDEFTNTYTAEKWTLQSNYKLSKTSEYHASEVILRQYEIVSKTNNFFGYLPSIIENQYVINPKTLELTAQLENQSPAILERFLNETPIGKGTKIALEAFEMRATWLDRQVHPVLHPISHFVLGVEPKPRSQFIRL